PRRCHAERSEASPRGRFRERPFTAFRVTRLPGTAPPLTTHHSPLTTHHSPPGGRALTERTRWFLVVLCAAAMAWVESAAVTYLRILVGRVHPYQPDPLPLAGNLGGVELIREVATLLMLFA